MYLVDSHNIDDLNIVLGNELLGVLIPVHTVNLPHGTIGLTKGQNPVKSYVTRYTGYYPMLYITENDADAVLLKLKGYKVRPIDENTELIII